MSEPFSDLDELRGLVDAVCDETATPQQVRRLEELVLAHPEAEVFYVQYMSQYAEVARHFAALPSPTERSLRGRLEGKAVVAARPRRPWKLAGVAAVAAVALAVTLYPSLRPADSPPQPFARPAEPEKLDNSVAVLLRAPAAVWDASEPAPRVNTPLPPGRLKLSSGCAHIEFYSGASVILQGPAELCLLAPNEAYCVRGKLRATVPPQAQGFRIGSPQLDVVDRGTEFGMEINDDEHTEVHVFQGKVELYDAGSGPNATARQELTTGQGVRLKGMGDVSSIPADPTGFSTAADLAERQKQELRRRQEIWSAASDALRNDPSVLVYFSFQEQETFSRTLSNQALNRPAAHDGVIVGCQWVAGRWPGKLGLDFKQVSDRVRFHVPGEYNCLTLAAWVRIDALPNRFNSLMMTDGWDEREPHWHISDAGLLELGVQGLNKKNGIHYYGPEIFSSDRFGRWAHVAVVYDRDNRQVAHYVDGKLVCRLPIQVSLPLRLGDVELGNWNVATHQNKSPVRYFTGCMDEFMMFARALGDAEVERLYSQGQPPQ